MVAVRWHGRGGQGAVTAAEILAKAAINEGRWAQAFPAFGPERRGAPVLAFTRISDKPITIRSEVYEPDVVVVLDSSLLKVVDVKAGLKDGGTAVLNTKAEPSEVKKKMKLKGKVAAVDATTIAIETLGKPITNTAIIGALVKATELVQIESVIETTKEVFPGDVGIKNANAIKRAYEEVKIEGE